jgi:chorismate mutase/prephenate dehydratase
MSQKISNTLLNYRKEIDDIDYEIIDLLNKRMQIVDKVGCHKKEMKDRFFIRSNREADMIKNLIKRSGDKIPKPIIISIWRKIITAANILEQEVKIGIHNPQKLVKYHNILTNYYSEIVDVNDFTSSTNVISAIEKNNIRLGIFYIDDKFDNIDHWWINMANSKNGLKVFAKIPFISYKDNNLPQDELFVTAIKEPEQSSEDKTLLVIELDQIFQLDKLEKALQDSDLEAKILKKVKLKDVRSVDFYLIEVDGFYDENHKKIKLLENCKIKPYVRIIGHYPTQIIL